MPELTNTTAHRAARNAASIAMADTGAGVASIKLYVASGGTLLAVRNLAKPCGTVNGAGRIALGAALGGLVGGFFPTRKGGSPACAGSPFGIESRGKFIENSVDFDALFGKT